MYLVIFYKIFLAGLVMLFWQRIIAATSFGRLSWPFLPVENFVSNDYNNNVKFSVGVGSWLVLSFLFSVIYWQVVEGGWLTYYDFGSGFLFGFFLWLVTVVFIFPITKLGLIGYRLGRWVWLESLVAWLIFGIIFGLLIS